MTESTPELDWLMAGPPVWYRWMTLLLSLLTGLCFALTVMLQWGIWLIVTSQILRPWGMAIGVVICVIQMFAIFEDRQTGGHC